MSEIRTPATLAAPVEPKPEPKSEPVDGWIDSSDPKQMARLVLPKDESDFNWDYKMEIPVPEVVNTSLAVEGWDESMPLKVVKLPGDDKLYVVNGRTKLRSIPEVNKRRKKNKLPPIQIPWKLDTKRSPTQAVLQGYRLNAAVQHIDPITTAKEIQRLLGTPKDENSDEIITEGDLAPLFGMTVKEIQEHYALLRLPAKVQKLVAEERMTVSAALALVHLDESKVEDAAAKIVAVAESQGRVTHAAAKQAAGTRGSGTDRMTPKSVKQLVKELKAADVKGKHGGQVRRAAILALETYLDADKADDFWDALAKLGAE